jgi:hypothetical protein
VICGYVLLQNAKKNVFSCNLFQNENSCPGKELSPLVDKIYAEYSTEY